jgi:hypothetical protein
VCAVSHTPLLEIGWDWKSLRRPPAHADLLEHFGTRLLF